MRTVGSGTWLLGITLAACGAVTAAAPGQQTPGIPTKPSVWVENRGADQAVPITVERVSAPINVQVVGVPTFALNSGAVVTTRPVRQAWEYRILTVKAGSDGTGELNAAGGDGWEVVGVTATSQQGTAMLLKRPR
jgi:hypothetical protein